MDTLKRLSVVTDNFEELKQKVLELTKNDFSWALECNIEDEDSDIVDTKLLILSDFKYDIEEEDSDYKTLSVKITYEKYLSDVIEDVSNNVQIIFYQHNDKLFKVGMFEIQTRDKNILNAFYTLFEEMELL